MIVMLQHSVIATVKIVQSLELRAPSQMGILDRLVGAWIVQHLETDNPIGSVPTKIAKLEEPSA